MVGGKWWKSRWRVKGLMWHLSACSSMVRCGRRWHDEAAAWGRMG
jgi:hypothetical protein